MRSSRLALAVLASLALTTPALAGTPTAHRLSFQGLARNTSNQVVQSGDVRVRIYDAPTGGTLTYDSGTEFAGAILTGVFDVVLGNVTPLLLDDTRQYYLEQDVNGQEVVGDAAGGRQAFWPAGGDQTRSDLETRIQNLENLVFAQCSAGTFNLNGNPTDGCEFTLDANGIYVDTNDPGADDNAGCGKGPVGTGAGCRPCRSIAQGLTEATAQSRSKIYVADGTYAEAVTLVNGKSLLGGYRGITWERHLSSTATILSGESVSGSHKRAVVGTNITSATTVEGFVIFGPSNATTGGNSYAVYLSNAGGLTLQNNTIVGGIGGPGGDGAAPAAASDGAPGAAGANAIQSLTSSCSGLDRSGGVGGSLVCGITNVSGGAGGGNRCTPAPNTKFSGLDGTAGTGGGGAAGTAGFDAQLSGGICTLPNGGSSPVNGNPGSNGVVGSNGAAGSGASTSVGSVVSGNWIGVSGAAGFAATPGRGGGGGGGGGGSDGISPEKDVLGGAGGGGGSGGCGGGAGAAGVSGGGSFGVLVSGGSAPVITSNKFVRGYGGPGGRGGVGGKGGAGGLGGAGGTASFFCSGAGGKGGDGGAGGHGGGGGGGAGGISCGIFTSGIGTPTYGTSNTFSGGAAGGGGAGGPSVGNSGTAGVAGTLSSVTSQ